MDNNEIYRIYGTEYKEMTKKLLRQASLRSTISDGRRVLIKPNLVNPTPAEFGATTHPEIVAGIVEYLQENGVSDIIIAESSWVGDKTSEAFEYCGYNELSRRYGVPLFDVKKEKYHPVDCGGIDINITDVLKADDFVINVPVLKGHGQTAITFALKNMKGLIPDSEKRLFHRLGLHKPIGHLLKGIRQDFIVADHICGDLVLEDGGNPVVKNCIMCGTDPVVMDYYGAYLLKLIKNDPGGTILPQEHYLFQTYKLFERNFKLSDIKVRTFKMDDTDAISVIRAGESDCMEDLEIDESFLVDIKYMIDDIDSCSGCYDSLMPALLRLREEGLLKKLSEKLGGKICIGQGYEGKTGGFGIGKCCRAFDKCIMGCPPKEDVIYSELRSFCFAVNFKI